MTTYQTEDREDYRFVSFTLDRKPLALERDRSDPVCPTRCGQPEPPLRGDPFDPGDGIEKRLKHTGCRHAVVGISGGLDSTRHF